MTSIGKLFIVATPIGNLGDMTFRALDALRESDVIYAEDTRVTSKLLSSYDISGKHVNRLDENSMRDRLDDVVCDVQSGRIVAFCSDAGMPGVSDPGMQLVSRFHELELPVEVLPGASAILTAYVSSGTSSPHFCFLGFAPRKDGERAELLDAYADIDAALILYESPKRLTKMLAFIGERFPHRDVAVCRELTKLHEEVFRGKATDVAEEFAARELTDEGVRGEIVIVIDGPSEEERARLQERDIARARRVCESLGEAGLTGKTLASAVQEICEVPRNIAYELAVENDGR